MGQNRAAHKPYNQKKKKKYCEFNLYFVTANGV